MKMLLAVSLWVIAVVPCVHAVVAERGVRTVVQPDGTTVDIQVVGDEFMHLTTTANGVLLKLNAEGYYDFGILGSDGSVKSSGVRYSVNPEYLEAVNISDIDREVLFSKHCERRKVSAQKGLGLTSRTFRKTGSPRSLVILVEYADETFSLDNPTDYFNEMINGDNFTQYGGTGSVLQYFSDQSGGLFTPKFDVVGPITLPEPRSFYGGNNEHGNDENAYMMVSDAVELLDPTVDFSVYDNDGDGIVDNIYIFYAGEGEASHGGEDTVWPHSADIRNKGVVLKVDGVTVANYACSNEWKHDRPDGIGTFVHEFSHVLGLPDLYATENAQADYTPHSYSVLDYGPYNNDGRTPPNYGAYEKNALGWYEPIVLDGPADIRLNDISSGQFALIPTLKDYEFFLLENRQKEGWDAYIEGHGMLIWHIDYQLPGLFDTNSVNNFEYHQFVDIVEANNQSGKNHIAGWSFPGNDNVTSFTETTVPGLWDWDDNPIDIPVTDISENDEIITFKVCGGSPILETPVGFSDGGSSKDGYFVASWTAVDGATDYLLTVYAENASISPESSGTKSVDEVLPGYNAVSTEGVTTYVVDHLRSGTSNYYFVVQATDGVNVSGESEPVHVTVLDADDADIVMSDIYTAEPEYYNLQGVRIATLTPGMVVFKRQGTQVSKIMVR